MIPAGDAGGMKGGVSCMLGVPDQGYPDLGRLEMGVVHPLLGAAVSIQEVRGFARDLQLLL